MKLYVTDLDGTLLNEKAEVSEYSRIELNRLLQTEKITFFTARSYSVTKKLLEGINWNLPCVVNNGAFIVDYLTGKIIDGVYINNTIVNNILTLAKKIDLSCIMLGMNENEEKMIYSNLNNAGIQEYIEQRKRKNDNRLLEWKNYSHIGKIQVFSLQFVDSYEKLRRLQEEIEKYNVVTYLDKEIYVEGFYYLNINNADATKERALSKVVDMLGLSMEDVTVFGDQINDLELLKQAGVGVAVGNANNSLKAVADVVIGNNTENSVVRYISNQLG